MRTLVLSYESINEGTARSLRGGVITEGGEGMGWGKGKWRLCWKWMKSLDESTPWVLTVIENMGSEKEQNSGQQS